ncbi:hypothetical protein ACWCSD_47065, partial [Nonomuraea sp. NPDC001684]
FAHNDLARSFALRAIAAQPLDYLREVARDTSLAFTWSPVPHPRRMSPSTTFPRGSWPLPEQQALIAKVRSEYDPGIHGMSSVEPYASILAAYPYPWFLHGTVFGVLLLAGGLGSAGRRRPALLPWATAAFLLLAPVAALDFDHRYVLPAIPFACVSAALAVAGAVTGRATGTATGTATGAATGARTRRFPGLTFRRLTSLRKNT